MRTILLVEQAGPMRTLLMRNVATATNAEINITEDYDAAARMIAGGGFDCALIAFNFSTGDGFRLVKKLRGMGVVTKLVLMSTGDMENQSIAAGANAFILKQNCTGPNLRTLFQSLNLE